MKKTGKWVIEYPLGIAVYTVAAVLSAYRFTIAPFLLFVLLAGLEIVLFYRERKTFLDLRILFSASWLLGIALATLDLSELHSVWGVKTWFAAGLFYFGFLGGYDLFSFLRDKRKRALPPEEKKEKTTAPKERLLLCVLLLCGAGFAAFLIESVVFRFAYPAFVFKGSAYTEFHITGIHYFLTSLIFVPPLSLMAVYGRETAKKERIVLTVCNVFSFLVPILLLSKLQLALTLVLPFLCFALLQKKYSGKRMAFNFLLIVAVSAVLFALIVERRTYPEGHLLETFRFRNPDVPLFLQYPYIYVVNNFENLNELISADAGLTFGVRMLSPFFSLTGLKFIPAVSILMDVPVFLTTPYLNTLTILYDAYGDFGMVGSVGFGLILGVLSSAITRMVERSNRVVPVLFDLLFMTLLSLSFFTTWFSHPTVWFWMILILVLGFISEKKKGDGRSFKSVLRAMGGYHDS